MATRGFFIFRYYERFKTIYYSSNNHNIMFYHTKKKLMHYKETEILSELDYAFHGKESPNFPAGNPEDTKYNFFIDLENGYSYLAGSKIHVYGDANNWAIVFEQNGYHTRQVKVNLDLIYVGNCINYIIEEHHDRNYISNQNTITLIESSELNRIQNKNGNEMENFELIDLETKQIKIRNKTLAFNNNHEDYKKIGILIRDYDNPNNLIGFEDMVRYIHETEPNILEADEFEIRKHIPKNLDKIMTLNDFHYVSSFEDDLSPSKQETYQMIAKVICKLGANEWKPTKKANNNWRNWEPGNL